MGGMIILEWLWVLTRDPLAIGSAEHTAMKDKVFAIIDDKIPHYDKSNLRPTQQTEAEGCVYKPL